MDAGAAAAAPPGWFQAYAEARQATTEAIHEVIATLAETSKSQERLSEKANKRAEDELFKQKEDLHKIGAKDPVGLAADMIEFETQMTRMGVGGGKREQRTSCAVGAGWP